MICNVKKNTQKFALFCFGIMLITTSCGKQTNIEDNLSGLEDPQPTSQEWRNALYEDKNADKLANYAAAEDNDIEQLKHGKALWNSIAGTTAWTNLSLNVIRSRKASLEMARDKNTFCPGYESASHEEKETCWLRVISSVARFESAFNPSDSFREANGQYSVGLLALSTGECNNAPSKADLKNPLKNLFCGINKMANLIARDGYIEGPDGNRGAAAYWSVLRKPYRYRRHVLGKKFEIIRLTREYKNI